MTKVISLFTSTWSKSSWPAYSRPKDTEKYQLMIKVEKVNFVRAMASLIMTNACSFFWFLAKNTMMVVDEGAPGRLIRQNAVQKKRIA